MADVHSKETRSYNMSKIKNKDTKPEEIIRKYLFSKGFRYRKNDRRLPGTPDIVLPKHKTVIFINGCFWHAHRGCRWFVRPKSNQEFWDKKLDDNVERDQKNYEKLYALGWKVIVLWECEIRHKKIEETCKKLLDEIEGEKR